MRWCLRSVQSAAHSYRLQACKLLFGTQSVLSMQLWKIYNNEDRVSRSSIVLNGVLSTIGNTPLVRIESLSKATGCEVRGLQRNTGKPVRWQPNIVDGLHPCNFLTSCHRSSSFTSISASTSSHNTSTITKRRALLEASHFLLICM